MHNIEGSIFRKSPNIKVNTIFVPKFIKFTKSVDETFFKKLSGKILVIINL